MSKMVVTYQSLLQDISHRCNEADRAHIRQVLESVSTVCGVHDLILGH